MKSGCYPCYYKTNKPIRPGDYILDTQNNVHRVKEIKSNIGYTALVCTDGRVTFQTPASGAFTKPTQEQIEEFKKGNIIEVFEDYNKSPCVYFTGKQKRNCRGCRANNEDELNCNLNLLPSKNRCYNIQMTDLIRRMEEIVRN